MPKRKQPKDIPNFVDLRGAPLIQDVQSSKYKRTRRQPFRLYITLGIISLVSVFAVLTASHRGQNKVASPIPQSVSSSVSFPVYYPDKAKLPAGYNFDTTSITSASGAVIYTIALPQNEQINVSQQTLPSQADLRVFYSQRIPLHNDVSTPLGIARVSALNNRSLTSLPTDKTWILISAPYNIDERKLEQVLQSFRR